MYFGFNISRERNFQWVLALPLVVLLVMLATSSLPAQDAEKQEAPEPVTVPEAVDLRPGLEAGRSSRFSLNHQWTIRGSVAAGDFKDEHTATLKVAGELVWKVTRVDGDGKAHCVIDVDWLTAEIKADDQTMAVDSRKARGEPEQLHKLFKAVADTPLKVTVTQDGTVKDFDATPITRKLGDDGSEMLASLLKILLHPREFALLPEAPKEAKIDATWKHKFERDSEHGTFDADAKNTLVAVELIADIPVATVMTEATLKHRATAAGDLPPGMKVDVRVRKATSESQTLFDLQRRETVGRHATEHYDMQITTTGEGMSMTMTVQQDAQLQVLRIAEE